MKISLDKLNELLDESDGVIYNNELYSKIHSFTNNEVILWFSNIMLLVNNYVEIIDNQILIYNKSLYLISYDIKNLYKL